MKTKYLHTLCGTVTSAGEHINQEIVRGSAWCDGCEMPRPIGELRWTEDGTQVR